MTTPENTSHARSKRGQVELPFALIAFLLLILTGVVVAAILVATALNNLSQQSQIQGCKSIYANRAQQARNQQGDGEYNGLRSFGLGDTPGLNSALADGPKIHDDIERTQAEYEAAIRLSITDPDRFVARCNADVLGEVPSTTTSGPQGPPLTAGTTVPGVTLPPDKVEPDTPSTTSTTFTG